MKRIINVAIIAHVDAGKSTLVDALLEQSGAFNERDERIEQVMDSDDIERERGITIYSKPCAINYKDIKINIVDTPGHADFSGEVERIIRNVDTVILLVDSSEGPMPQTRFVLKKSLEIGLKPIVVINKIDKKDSRVSDVVDTTLELFMDLDATEEQMNFPVLYGIAKDGIVQYSMEEKSTNIIPLFETLINHVGEYPHTEDENTQMQISSLKYDKYLGRLGLGRLIKGTLNQKQKYSLIDVKGNVKTIGFSKIFTNKGLSIEETDSVQPGDLCTVAGIPDITIGETISSIDNPEPAPPIQIEEPTISMNFLVNKSPMKGQEGKKITSNVIFSRLQKELETNVALKVRKLDDGEEGFEVQGRGELHLSVLLENMRREGFELAVSKPKVLLKTIGNKKMEPYEQVQVICDDEFSGNIIQLLSERKGQLINMSNLKDQSVMEFVVPTRGLIGIRQTFITKTRGTGILEKTFYKYDKYAGLIEKRKNGVLVSTEKGNTMGYSLWKISDRGSLFVGPQTEVYKGMIIGIHSKSSDLDVNPIKNKQMTNIRSSGTDESIKVPKPIILSLEESLEFIEDDELVEITPKSIRLRKKILDKRYRAKE